MDATLARGPRLLLGAVFLAYFAGTALLYFLGPWTYPMPQGTGWLIVFLLGVHAAFAAGSIAGSRGHSHAARLPLSVDTVVLAAVATELLLLFPTSAHYTGHWIPNPFAAARDLGAAYAGSLAIRGESTPYVNYVRMLVAPLLAAAVPLAMFYWHELRVITRGLFGASIVGTIALFMSMGANAGAGHWLAIFPWFVLARHLAGVHRIGRTGRIVAGIILTGSVVLVAVLFSATMVQRQGSYAKAGYIPGIDAYIGTTPTPVVSPLGILESPHAARSVAKIGVDGLAAYMTQGYFAVYLSLQLPFLPCYGVGNSVFLQRQVARLTGNPAILQCPYPVRLQERGWFVERYWATIYPWIASDVSFPGTVVVIYLIAWASSRVWLDVLGGHNPYAVALLGQFLLMLYYVPAHNKIMHSGEGVLAFVTLLGAWLATRSRRVDVIR